MRVPRLEASARVRGQLQFKPHDLTQSDRSNIQAATKQNRRQNPIFLTAVNLTS